MEYDSILVCNITVNKLYEGSKAAFRIIFNILWSFLRQVEGADLPFAPPMKGPLFLVPNGIRPVMQRTAIEVCSLVNVVYPIVKT